MKFIHLSDLHLGKRVNEFSMLEDQAYILEQILSVIDQEQPQAVLIAGDVYDKAIPSAEAVSLFDDFLYQLARRNLQVFVISGNHDSPERIAFGSRMMQTAGIHLSPVYDGNPVAVDLQDEYGVVTVHLLPFIKPAHVRAAYPDEPIESYTDAMAVAIRHMTIDPTGRNLLVTHQFVTGAVRSDSENLSVGGSDNVDCEVFEPFDYVALGHIHGPQSAGRETVRYCGTPLKYSFSEAAHQKSVAVVQLLQKGSVQLHTVPLVPLRDLRELRGTYNELTHRGLNSGAKTLDYLHITQTDEEDQVDAIGRLRAVYPNLMKLDYDNRRTRSSAQLEQIEALESKSPLDLFAAFYEQQNGSPMSERQREFSAAIIRSIWEEEV